MDVRIVEAVGTAIHSDDPNLEAAMYAASDRVLEECRVEGFIWTNPEEVRRRKLAAFNEVRVQFGRPPAVEE